METTPMHVIKLVYICHGWMLGLFGRSLINDPVEAWRYGPVVPSVYQTYRSFRGSPITIDAVDNSDSLDEKQNKLIDAVLDAYRDYTAWQLSTITHQTGTPWHSVYEDGKGQGSIIPNELIGDYYKALSAS